MLPKSLQHFTSASYRLAYSLGQRFSAPLVQYSLSLPNGVTESQYVPWLGPLYCININVQENLAYYPALSHFEEGS